MTTSTSTDRIKGDSQHNVEGKNGKNNFNNYNGLKQSYIYIYIHVLFKFNDGVASLVTIKYTPRGAQIGIAMC